MVLRIKSSEKFIFCSFRSIRDDRPEKVGNLSNTTLFNPKCYARETPFLVHRSLSKLKVVKFEAIKKFPFFKSISFTPKGTT